MKINIIQMRPNEGDEVEVASVEVDEDCEELNIFVTPKFKIGNKKITCKLSYEFFETKEE